MKITEENLREKEYTYSESESPYNWGGEYWIYLRKVLSFGDIFVAINRVVNIKRMGLISPYYTPRSYIVEDTSDYVAFLERSLKRHTRKLKERPENSILHGRIELVKEVLQELRAYDVKNH
ncbi:MAG: hypothetical protein QMD36_00065 [Candidatus Aenigmarchaeota archaeon]|nr:hypothetical protein [Candidatus Aenigmarchaeota archaeon]